ncbi:MAG: hypothetical protein MJ177_00490 [Clostridia bacterium]|nr:hypothetical protein [Clostridia bacterium]
MNSFISDFYIGNNLHRVEVLASPFKSSQKIFVDNKPFIDHKGTLVNGHMFYDITVENVPLVVSIRDCGLCCECNVFLDNVSIIDGARLDARKTEAEKNIEEGFSKYMLKNTGRFLKQSVIFAVLFILLYILMAGFNAMVIYAGLIAYPIAFIFNITVSWEKQKSTVEKWYRQYQQWQGAPHSI